MDSGTSRMRTTRADGEDPRGPVGSAAWLRARLGPGWAERVALDPTDGETALFRWWTACVLRAAERREARVDAALAALAERGWLAAGPLAGAGTDLAALLAAAEIRTPEPAAARLARAAAALEARHDGSLERLASGAPSLEELGGRLVWLGPGVGPGTALRFLRPLRDHWAAAEEVPLDAAAQAAAVHLGWLDALDEPETAPHLLRRRLDDEADAPPLPVVEEALERLGRAACRRGNTRRCPLGDACPGRDA